jgi:hypothetical protein
MSNEFVEYLKSMNNATSGNINALAESQVTNKFYESIRVERKLGKNISERIKEGKKEVYILTGHAGDGKTSILVQVLKDLGLLNKGEKLKVEDDIKAKVNLFYVKDMSELTLENQKKLLKKALKSPENNSSAILISNTGPLLNSFQEVFGFSEQVKDKIERNLLDQLDRNENKMIEVCDYKFYLINIARIDNIGFVKEIINKICSSDNWLNCLKCENLSKCPIYLNYKCINENISSVINFIESYYRWLYENDKRITIRQMLAQISFGITGNVKCEDIKKWDKRVFIDFQYNFANLFFGYKGINQLTNARQIKAVDYIQDMELDSIALRYDYEMFVKNNFLMLPNGIRKIIEGIWSEYSKRYLSVKNETSDSEIERDMRKAIRRFYLMYGMEDEKSINTKNKEIFGEIFVDYKELISKKQSTRSLRSLKKIIFESLYIKNIGIAPKNENKLYLTLTRYDGAFQSVLLLLGKVGYDDLEVVQQEKNTENEDVEQKYDIYLSINNAKEMFKLNLPILMHFKTIVDGAISTEVNPSLSHGLAELNSKLIKEFRFSDGENLRMIVNTVSGTIEVQAEFDDDKVYIY